MVSVALGSLANDGDDLLSRGWLHKPVLHYGFSYLPESVALPPLRMILLIH